VRDEADRGGGLGNIVDDVEDRGMNEDVDDDDEFAAFGTGFDAAFEAGPEFEFALLAIFMMSTHTQESCSAGSLQDNNYLPPFR
jgi:hypothetical protein